ncbi:MAG: hypothetical protein AB7V50_02995 [Vampirovibrionia bacterium]
MKKLLLIITMLSCLLGVFFISPAKAISPTQDDINYIHDFFSDYCDFHEAFHSFLDGNGIEYYNKKTPEQWQAPQTQINTIYDKLKTLKPTPQFTELNDKYLDVFKQQVNIWDKYINAKNNNQKDYDITDFMTELSMNRINISKYYGDIYRIYNTWPKEDKDKINTPDLMTKWNRMEMRKRKIINKY